MSILAKSPHHSTHSFYVPVTEKHHGYMVFNILQSRTTEQLIFGIEKFVFEYPTCISNEEGRLKLKEIMHRKSNLIDKFPGLWVLLIKLSRSDIHEVGFTIDRIMIEGVLTTRRHIGKVIETNPDCVVIEDSHTSGHGAISFHTVM